MRHVVLSARSALLLSLGGAAGLLCLDTPTAALAAPAPWLEACAAARGKAVGALDSTDMADSACWPDDPGYGYVAGRPNERTSGQWPFYSFIPDRSAGAPPMRAGETAAGMSIDLAWRHTMGDDRVVVAVLDSGLKWASVLEAGIDLSLGIGNKAFLNRGELASHPPHLADGSDCGGTGDLAGFDCNGDGILNVLDYADDPHLTPAATGTSVAGDVNRNGLLDPSDLIANFSDGTDDDANGYVDDISGWDFYKNDNDPFDDTFYLHGTEEASWSTAQTNDGMGDAGVCPACRFLPLRVGDSFIADAQDFSKAVLYAVDAKATIIQEALGTIDMTRFAQSALDYAWDHGVPVIASMADENARHHNFPVTANRTIPVHAITMQSVAEESTTATSFLAFNNCTNFGAQNFLSVSGLGCSSEGAGRLGGISGLMASMGLQAALDPPLSAGEIAQLLYATADDIDLPESREPGAVFYWSQPGFDQRFGYGRVNANTAVESVKDGKIPPVVDVVQPYWFDVLYADAEDTLVPIMGTVSAARAPSYDYLVEWAPGVQPPDDAFTVVLEEKNVAGDVVTGADGAPLAELDVATIDPTHEPDPDSPFGENQYTITVRVRAVAHYGGSIGDVRGELRRAYAVHRDPDLLPGFPIRTADSLESSPKLHDFDGDGVRDIVQATGGGEIHVYSLAGGKPTLLPGFPVRAKLLDGFDGDATRTDYRGAAAFTSGSVDTELARESFTATPAIGDVDGDGKAEIVATTTHGTIHAFHGDGTPVSGWPVRLPDVPSCPTDRDHVGEICMGVELGEPDSNDDVLKTLARGAFGSPVLEDMNGDGKLDVIQAAFDGHVHVFSGDGSAVAGWPVRVHHPSGATQEYNRILTTPAVADFNGDGTPDVLVGSNERLGSGKGAGAFYLIDGRGTAAGNPPYLPNWPVSVVSFNLFPVVAEGATVSPIVAKIGDVPHGVMHGNASAPLILPLDPGSQSSLGSVPVNAHPERIDDNTGEPVRGLPPTSIFGAQSRARTPDTMFPLFAQPSAGDFDQDGVPDIVTSGGSLSLAQNLLSTIATGSRAQFLMSIWSGKTGEMMPASPIPLEDFSFFNNPTVADLSGDGYPEAIQGTGGYYVRAVDACGREADGFPKFTNQWIIASAAVGDVTGDGSLEVVVGTRSGYLYAWKTKGKSDGVIAWESYHHDNRNTGNYDVKLDQGKLKGAKPLRVKNGKCVEGGAAEDDGGCSCRIPGRNPPRDGTGVLLLALGAALARRSRLPARGAISGGTRRGAS